MVILGMPWLARHNPEIDWRMGEVKMTRCSEECGKQWRPEQGKSGWEKQKEEEAKKEVGRKQEKKEKKKKTEERKDGRSQESSRGVGNLEQRRRSSKIRRGSKKDGSREVP